MTTEEMIEELEFCHINGQGSGQIHRIQAALRAGQAMRDATTDWDFDAARAAWDAATNLRESLSGCSECDAEGCSRCEP